MAKTGFEAVKKTIPLALELIGSILIFLFVGIMGCSDLPYTGSMLTADDVDRYLVSLGEDTYCLQNGPDLACITLTPRRQGTNAPIIHIYPQKLIYVFYHEGKPIVRAGKLMDTADIVKALPEPPPQQPSPQQPPQQPSPQQPPQQPPPQQPPPQQPPQSPPQSPPEPPPQQPPQPPPPQQPPQQPPEPPQQPPPEPPPPQQPPQQPPQRRIPTTLEEVSGNGQSGEVNQYLTNPLVVRVLDQHGDVLSGVTVSFSVLPSSGVLSPTSPTTGSNGEASTTLQLGSTAGIYTVTASVSGIDHDVTFTATAIDPPRPTTLQKVSGDGQSGEVNQNLVNPLVVRVLDQHGDVLLGVTVGFTVLPSSGVLSPTSATTDSDGEASTILRLGSTAGTYTVTASVSGIDHDVTFTATAIDLPPLPPSRIATTLEYRRGNGQSGEVNQHLTNPLVVRVLDQHSAVLSGVTVSFSVRPSSGVLSPTSATTGSNGEASTTLQLGSTAGTYTVTASVSGIDHDVTFTATAIDPPRPTTLEYRRGNGQSGEINQHLTNPLVVRVLDQHGDVLSGVTVSFSVRPSSGVLSPTSATTGSNGEASTTLQLGSTAGTYTVTASVSGIAQGVTFTATAIDPPRPTTLEYRRGNGQSGEINQRLANPLVVRVLDQHSAVLSGITVNFSVSPSGSLSSQGPTTDANGEASTELTLGSTTGKYIITASVSGLSSVTFVATATNNSGRSNGGNNDGNSGKNDGNNDGNSGNNGGNNDGNSGKNGGNNDGNSGNNGGNNGGNGGNNGGLAGNSHLFFTQNSPVDVEGWLVQIYYPENYKGPRGLGEGALGGTSGPTPGESPYGFTVSVNNNDGKITQFAQTAGPCDDYDGDGEYDFPCNANFDHPSDEPGSVYSVQIEIETTKKKLTFHVAWDQSAANWNGTPASNTTYTLDADINMSGDDPHHTSQGN